MQITDRVYGYCQTDDNVLIELIHSSPLQRLKMINQSGVSHYLFPWKNVTRLEHSLGVMLLLKKYHASLEEQVVGLLHDISHTAFSHVADFVFANQAHEYHELHFQQVVKNSTIESILNKYQINLHPINHQNYPLLERDMPDLCADRIDYSLRDFMAGMKNIASIKTKLTGLIVKDNEFMFADYKSAELFGQDFLAQDRDSWANEREIAAYELFAQALRHALDKGFITNQDLFTDDEQVMQKLTASGDNYIQKKLAYLTPKFRIVLATPGHYHLKVQTKVRYVDPKVVVNGQIKRLSELSTEYKQVLADHLESGKKPKYLLVYPE